MDETQISNFLTYVVQVEGGDGPTVNRAMSLHYMFIHSDKKRKAEVKAIERRAVAIGCKVCVVLRPEHLASGLAWARQSCMGTLSMGMSNCVARRAESCVCDLVYRAHLLTVRFKAVCMSVQPANHLPPALC